MTFVTAQQLDRKFDDLMPNESSRFVLSARPGRILSSTMHALQCRLLHPVIHPPLRCPICLCSLPVHSFSFILSPSVVVVGHLYKMKETLPIFCRTKKLSFNTICLSKWVTTFYICGIPLRLIHLYNPGAPANNIGTGHKNTSIFPQTCLRQELLLRTIWLQIKQVPVPYRHHPSAPYRQAPTVPMYRHLKYNFLF